MVDRYDFEVVTNNGVEYYCKKLSKVDGEFVKYEDYAKLEQKALELIDIIANMKADAKSQYCIYPELQYSYKGKDTQCTDETTCCGCRNKYEKELQDEYFKKYLDSEVANDRPNTD